MEKFVIMQLGFEKPSPEDMAKWGAWFGSIKGSIVENIGLMGGKEIRADGTTDLSWDGDCVTGMSIVEAEDLDAAVKLTEGCPYINAVRVYKMRSH